GSRPEAVMALTLSPFAARPGSPPRQSACGGRGERTPLRAPSAAERSCGRPAPTGARPDRRPPAGDRARARAGRSRAPRGGAGLRLSGRETPGATSVRPYTRPDDKRPLPGVRRPAIEVALGPELRAAVCRQPLRAGAL